MSKSGGFNLVILIFVLVIIYFVCCRPEKGEVIVDFSSMPFTAHLQSKSKLTTGCKVKFKGNLDCDVQLRIKGENSLHLKAGEVDVVKKFECYNDGKYFTILADSCSQNSTLKLVYSFSIGYFSQK